MNNHRVFINRGTSKKITAHLIWRWIKKIFTVALFIAIGYTIFYFGSMPQDSNIIVEKVTSTPMVVPSPTINTNTVATHEIPEIVRATEVTNTATPVETFKIVDPTKWPEINFNSGCKVRNIDGTSYSFPISWDVYADSSLSVGTCLKNVEPDVNITDTSSIPEGISVLATGNLDPKEYVFSADGDLPRIDSTNTIVCSLTTYTTIGNEDIRVKTFKIVINPTSDQLAGEITGTCRVVSSKYLKSTILVLVRGIYDQVETTSPYIVNLPLEGNWLGNKPMVNLP